MYENKGISLLKPNTQHIEFAEHELLTWDTAFFGFKIGRIRSSFCTPVRMNSLIQSFRLQGYRLIYWEISQDDSSSRACAEILRLSPICMPVEYSLILSDYSKRKSTRNSEQGMTICSVNELTDDLLRLSFQAGRYSRFRMDKNFSRRQFEWLYHTWLSKSLERVLARDVLAAQVEDRFVGLVTLGVEVDSAKIGLFSVDKDQHRKGIGSTLMRTAIKEVQDWGINLLKVVTQHENTEACKFYERFGFKALERKIVYHIWI